jgi:hypothetical protein
MNQEARSRLHPLGQTIMVVKEGRSSAAPHGQKDGEHKPPPERRNGRCLAPLLLLATTVGRERQHLARTSLPPPHPCHHGRPREERHHHRTQETHTMALFEEAAITSRQISAPTRGAPPPR